MFPMIAHGLICVAWTVIAAGIPMDAFDRGLNAGIATVNLLLFIRGTVAFYSVN